MKIKLLFATLWGSFFIATFSIADVSRTTIEGNKYNAIAATKQQFKKEDITEIANLIDTHIEAANSEDIEAYMSTIHPDSVNREQNRQIMESIFSSYDLNFIVDEYEIVSVTEDRAEVRIVQTTTKIDGAEFRDNRLTAIHYLQKFGDRWQFLALQITDIEYLDVNN